MKRVVAASVLWVFVLWAACAAGAEKRKSVYELVPKDAFAFAAADDIGAYAKAFEGTALYKMLRHPGFKKCFAEALALKDLYGANIKDNFGLSPEEFLACFQGRAFVALLPPAEKQGPPVSFLAAFEVTGDVQKFTQAYNVLTPLLQQNPAVVRKEADGVVAFEIPTAPGGPVFAVSFAKYFLVIGMGAGAVLQFVKDIDAPGAAGVTSAKNFTKCAETLKPGKESLTLYVDMEFVYATYLKKIGVGNLQKVLALFDVDKLKAVLFEDRIVGKGFKDSLFLYTGGDGFFRPKHKIDFKSLKFIPAEADGLSVMSADFKDLYNGLESVAKAIAEREFGRIKEVVQKFEKEIGLSIRDDLLGTLGPEMGYFTSNYPGFIVFCQLQDRKKFDSAFKKLAGLNTIGRVATVEYKKHTITVFYPKVDVVALPLTPSYVVIDDTAFFSIAPNTLKSFINFYEKADKRLIKDNRDFSALAKAAGPGNAAVSYTEFKDIFESFYSALAFLAPLMNSQETVKFHTKYLPPVEDFAKDVFGVYSSTVITDDGVNYVMYSPTGPVTAPITLLGGYAQIYTGGKSGMGSAGTVAIIAVVAAIAIPNLLESTITTNEANAVKMLATYATEQEHFRENDYDMDGLKNYATGPASFMGLVDRGGNPIDTLPAEFITAVTANTPYKGYYYVVINDWVAARQGWGLCAVPAEYGTTGRKVFIINKSGRIYWQDFGAIKEVQNWPANPRAAGWKSF